MSHVDPVLVDKVRKVVGDFPHVQTSLEQLLSVKDADFEQISGFLNNNGLAATVEVQQFLNQALNYMPRETRIGPLAAIHSIAYFSTIFAADPQQVLLALREIYYPEEDFTRLLVFVDALKPAFEQSTKVNKRDFFAHRNSKFMSSVVSATDLRAVYKEDFSLAYAQESYDPVLDLESFVPLARIRLFFDLMGTDFLDFSCDLNALNSLIHSLTLTRKQLQALAEVATALESEGTYDPDNC